MSCPWVFLSSACPFTALLPPAPLLQGCSTDPFSCWGPPQCSPSCPPHVPQLLSASWRGEFVGESTGKWPVSTSVPKPRWSFSPTPNTPTSTDTGTWVGQHPRSHGWDAVWARKRWCICKMQLSIIYFYLENNDLAWYTLGKKKIPWRNLHWCKSEHFSQTVLGTFLFPGCFPSPEFAMKFWHGPLLTAPLYMSLEILCRRAKVKCPLCSERLAENEPCAQQSAGSSEKVNAARARGSVSGTVRCGRHRLLHPSSSLVQPFLTFSLSPILHLQHTSLTNILHMFFLKYLEYLPNFTLLIWELCKTNKH